MSEGVISPVFEPASILVPHGTSQAPFQRSCWSCRDCGDYTPSGWGLCARCAEYEE